MTRNRYWSTVMPIAGIVYVIVLMVVPNGHGVAGIGAMVLAIVALAAFFLPAPVDGRKRDRKRDRTAG